MSLSDVSSWLHWCYRFLEIRPQRSSAWLSTPSGRCVISICIITDDVNFSNLKRVISPGFSSFNSTSGRRRECQSMCASFTSLRSSLINAQWKAQGEAFSNFWSSVFSSTYLLFLCIALYISLYTLSSVSSTQGNCEGPFGSLASALHPRDSLRAISWINTRIHLICFPSLRWWWLNFRGKKKKTRCFL